MGILDLFKLDGKVALVTGAGQGIGRAYALGLAEAGADVAVCELNEKTGQMTADEITAIGRRSIFIKTDVTKTVDVQNMVERTVSELGSLDVAVNNAWAGGKFIVSRPAEEFPEAEWDFINNLALRALFVCSKHEIQPMIKQGRGKIIHMASMSASIANAGLAYCSAKAGVVMLTKRQALEWGKYNVNVNCISPSYTMSPARRADSKQTRDLMRSLHPMGWYERPVDLVGTLVYLASDASNYVTGQDHLVDGGHTLNVWLEPPVRTQPPLVSPEEESDSINTELDRLGITHDEDGYLL